ncbi:hypothetical protein ABKN59_009568 [Abortiporus biennis]
MDERRIQTQVEARMGCSINGTIQLTMGQRLFRPSSFTPAPLKNPPISSGMTDVLNTLKAILLKPSARDRYAIVPDLFRRIRYLLRVYYNARMTGRKPAEFKYCDVEDIYDVGLKLHRIGLTLQLTPSRLRALWASAPDLDKFLFDEDFDIGEFRIQSQKLKDAVNADPEAEPSEKSTVSEYVYKAGDGLCAYQMAYMIGDLLVAWIIIDPFTEVEKRRSDRALQVLVKYSASPLHRSTLGDPLTDAMTPIYTNQKYLVRFGLPALFDDWVASIGNHTFCKDAVETLPKVAWEHQTPESLVGIMRALISKLRHDGESLATTPVFARIIHEIYSLRARALRARIHNLRQLYPLLLPVPKTLS